MVTRADRARAEGIVLTPAGEPLFARDWARWVELGAVDDRTAAEVEEDAVLRAAADAAN